MEVINVLEKIPEDKRKLKNFLIDIPEWAIIILTKDAKKLFYTRKGYIRNLLVDRAKLSLEAEIFGGKQINDLLNSNDLENSDNENTSIDATSTPGLPA